MIKSVIFERFRLASVLFNLENTSWCVQYFFNSLNCLLIIGETAALKAEK